MSQKLIEKQKYGSIGMSRYGLTEQDNMGEEFADSERKFTSGGICFIMSA